MTSSSQQVDVISMIPTPVRNMLSISRARSSTKSHPSSSIQLLQLSPMCFRRTFLTNPCLPCLHQSTLPVLPIVIDMLLGPNDPTNLDFQFAECFIPDDFLHQDIRAGDNRHLIFATNQMLQLLSGAKNWYMDVTFNIISDPFYQLFSIHAFIKCDNCVKQVPLIFIVMSGKRAKDYKKVLKAVKSILPSMNLKTIAMDVETAI